jgi:hypothetical protein
MFEFIGIVVSCWIAFVILRGFFRATSTGRSKEYGKEVRHIAITDLLVPERYHRHITINKIDAVKQTALLMRDTNEDFQECSWPRLLALVIYGEYHQDCQQWQQGNPIAQQLFDRIGITPEMIGEELERNPSDVIYGNI